MKNLTHPSDEKFVRPPLSETVINWLNSEAGHRAVANALSNSYDAVTSLNEARKVQPEQLHEPITL